MWIVGIRHEDDYDGWQFYGTWATEDEANERAAWANAEWDHYERRYLEREAPGRFREVYVEVFGVETPADGVYGTPDSGTVFENAVHAAFDLAGDDEDYAAEDGD